MATEIRGRVSAAYKDVDLLDLDSLLTYLHSIKMGVGKGGCGQILGGGGGGGGGSSLSEIINFVLSFGCINFFTVIMGGVQGVYIGYC